MMNEPDIGELGIVLGYMIQNCPKFQLLPHLIDLYRYLIANDKIEDILDYNKSNPNIQTDKVLKLVKAGAPAGKNMVTPSVKQYFQSLLLLQTCMVKPADVFCAAILNQA